MNSRDEAPVPAHNNNFDGLRLIAAMLVLWAHMQALSARPVQLVNGVTYGVIGVLIFFSISGYLVMASWRSDPNIGRFMERRFLRIAPALLVVVPVTFVLVRALGIYGFPGNPLSATNGSLWTIELEVHWYLILLMAAVLCRHPVVLIAAAMGSVFAAFPWLLQLDTIDSYQFFFGIAFLIGMAMWEYPFVKRWSWVLVGIGVAAMPYSYGTTALIVAPISIWIGTRSWPVLRAGGRFGDLSYGVYVWAFPVQQFVVYYMGADDPYVALLATTVTVVFVIAWLSWHYVEKPALARKPVKPAKQKPERYELGNSLPETE